MQENVDIGELDRGILLATRPASVDGDDIVQDLLAQCGNEMLLLLQGGVQSNGGEKLPNLLICMVVLGRGDKVRSGDGRGAR